MKTERLGARAIWRINSYTNCWRKSMQIWPRRRANRVVFIVTGNCIVPIMIVNLAVGWPAMGATLQLLLCSSRLPQKANPGVGAFPGTQSLRGPGGRVDHGNDSWPEAGTCAAHPGSIADRLAHLEALAAMVAG